jgi:hypothetical protein
MIGWDEEGLARSDGVREGGRGRDGETQGGWGREGERGRSVAVSLPSERIGSAIVGVNARFASGYVTLVTHKKTLLHRTGAVGLPTQGQRAAAT